MFWAASGRVRRCRHGLGVSLIPHRCGPRGDPVRVLSPRSRCLWPPTWWVRRCWWRRWSPCGRGQPRGRSLRQPPRGWGPKPTRSYPGAPSQRRSCRPRPGPARRRVSCGNRGERRVGRRAVRCPPAAGGSSGHLTAGALPSMAGAMSSCPGPVPSPGSRCSVLGSGDGASWGHWWRPGRLTVESVCDRWMVKAVAP
jgi:hypothetical protein